MKSNLAIFILMKVICINGLENGTTENDASEFIPKPRQVITEDTTSLNDVEVAGDSEKNKTFEKLEVTYYEYDEQSTTAIRDVPEEDLFTTTTTPVTVTLSFVSLNRDFTSHDVPSFMTEEESNIIRRKPYEVLTATRGYPKTTRHTTLSSVSKASTTTTTSPTVWWLSRLWKKTRKSTSLSPVLTTPQTQSSTTSQTTKEPSTTPYVDNEATSTPTTSTYTMETTFLLTENSNEESSRATSPYVSTPPAAVTFPSVSTQDRAISSLSSSQTVDTEAHTDSSLTSSYLEVETSPPPVLTEADSLVEAGVTERSVKSKVDSRDEVLYLVAVISPCILLPLILFLLWVYLRRRVWGREQQQKMFQIRTAEEEKLMTLKSVIPGSARQSVIFLVPGQSLPNISAELKGRATNF